MLRLATITALVLFIFSGAHGQTRRASKTSVRTGKSSWRVFAPAGKGFRIEIPSRPQRIDDLYGDTDPNGYKSIDVYYTSQPATAGREYQIVVLVPSEAMREENPTGNDLGGIECMIGGDDAEPTSTARITVNGLKGKEFIYDLGKLLGHRKGRVIDAGTRVFVLIYASDAASDLNSSAATRFFRSFKSL